MVGDQYRRALARQPYVHAWIGALDFLIAQAVAAGQIGKRVLAEGGDGLHLTEHQRVAAGERVLRGLRCARQTHQYCNRTGRTRLRAHGLRHLRHQPGSGNSFVDTVLHKSLHSVAVNEEQREFLRQSIRTIRDYPKPGIEFRDITTLLRDRRALEITLEALIAPWR